MVLCSPTPLMFNINDHRTDGLIFYCLFAAFAADIWIAQRSGCTETFANRFTRTDHQHNDRERVWKHLQKETKIRVVIKRVIKPKQRKRTLNIENEAAQRTKSIRPKRGTDRVPLRENDET